VKGTRVISHEEFESSLERFDEPIRERFLALANELERLKTPDPESS